MNTLIDVLFKCGTGLSAPSVKVFYCLSGNSNQYFCQFILNRLHFKIKETNSMYTEVIVFDKYVVDNNQYIYIYRINVIILT